MLTGGRGCVDAAARISIYASNRIHFGQLGFGFVCLRHSDCPSSSLDDDEPAPRRLDQDEGAALATTTCTWMLVLARCFLEEHAAPSLPASRRANLQLPRDALASSIAQRVRGGCLDDPLPGPCYTALGDTAHLGAENGACMSEGADPSTESRMLHAPPSPVSLSTAHSRSLRRRDRRSRWCHGLRRRVPEAAYASPSDWMSSATSHDGCRCNEAWRGPRKAARRTTRPPLDALQPATTWHRLRRPCRQTHGPSIEMHACRRRSSGRQQRPEHTRAGVGGDGANQQRCLANECWSSCRSSLLVALRSSSTSCPIFVLAAPCHLPHGSADADADGSVALHSLGSTRPCRARARPGIAERAV